MRNNLEDIWKNVKISTVPYRKRWMDIKNGFGKARDEILRVSCRKIWCYLPQQTVLCGALCIYSWIILGTFWLPSWHVRRAVGIPNTCGEIDDLWMSPIDIFPKKHVKRLEGVLSTYRHLHIIQYNISLACVLLLLLKKSMVPPHFVTSWQNFYQKHKISRSDICKTPGDTANVLVVCALPVTYL